MALFTGAEAYILQVTEVTAMDSPAALFAQMVGGLSLFTGLFNLLPVPPLDGGHPNNAGVHAVRGEPLSAEVQDVASFVGVRVISLLMAVVTGFTICQFDDPNDLWNIIFPV